MGTLQLGSLLADKRWYGMLFNGRWIKPQNESVPVFEPATGEVLAHTAIGSAAEVEAAAKLAAKSQIEWATMGIRERAGILLRAADVLQSDHEALGRIVARETGGSVSKGLHEVREAIAFVQAAAALALQPRGEVLQSPVARLSLARRVPRGVVGVISPFNFPLILSTRAVAPALATGNAVVLKPDAQTPLSGGIIIARAFEEAGLPSGVLQLVPGGAEAGEALCVSSFVHMIQFTGSTAVGRRVAEIAGRTLKKVSLELGGNNALIVLDDADLDLAAGAAAWGAWCHQGQICMASGRIFVQRQIVADFTRRLAEKGKKLAVGDPVRDPGALGPVINERQLQRLKSILADSVAAGAKVECGGHNKGLFHEPTVLSGVKPGMRAFDEEAFGPITSIIEFGTDEEGLELANSHDGALAAAVISRSVSRALRIAERLNAGMVHINDQTVRDDANNPFGGPGVAGAGGAVGGPANLEEYTRWQWLTIREAPPQYPF